MSWFYSFQGQPAGPVDAVALLVLERENVISGSSLVWAEGMTDWQVLDAARPQVRAEAGDPDWDAYAVCAQSNAVKRKEDMVSYGEYYVAPEAKEAFVQSLQEGKQVGDLARREALRYAGFWWRVLAAIIDGLITTIVNVILAIPFLIFGWPFIVAFLESGGQFSPSLLSALTAAGWAALAFLILGALAFSCAYNTWMVGRYGATVGKLALSLRVVKADGGKMSYGQAFGRWAAVILDNIISSIFSKIGQLVIGAVFGVVPGQPPGSPVVLLATSVLSLAVSFVSMFPWWMAAFTPQKKALHDYVCGTRVINLN